MPMKSPRWTAIAESQFSWERAALDWLREELPDRDPWHVWTNFEFIDDDGKVNEVDALILAPSGLFLVEIKSRPGVITGDPHTWTWTTDGREYSYDNPLILANRKAKRLASVLRKLPSVIKSKVRLPWVEPIIFLSATKLNCKLEGNVMVIGSRVRVAAILVASSNSRGTPAFSNSKSSVSRSPGPTRLSSPHSTPLLYQAAAVCSVSGRLRSIAIVIRSPLMHRQARQELTNSRQAGIRSGAADQVISGTILRRVCQLAGKARNYSSVAASLLSPGRVGARSHGVDERARRYSADVLEGNDEEHVR